MSEVALTICWSRPVSSKTQYGVRTQNRIKLTSLAPNSLGPYSLNIINSVRLEQLREQKRVQLAIAQIGNKTRTIEKKDEVG